MLSFGGKPAQRLSKSRRLPVQAETGPPGLPLVFFGSVGHFWLHLVLLMPSKYLQGLAFFVDNVLAMLS